MQRLRSSIDEQTGKLTSRLTTAKLSGDAKDFALKLVSDSGISIGKCVTASGGPLTPAHPPTTGAQPPEPQKTGLGGATFRTGCKAK
jgi:hypothetical protein